MDIDYPDDAISQALYYWLVIAQACGLIRRYEFKASWQKQSENMAEIETQENGPQQ